MRACQLKNEVYEPKKLEAVYQNIVARSRTEKPQFYEIRVDDFTVVEKTSDPERFMNYSEFIDVNTKHISVFLYHNNSNSSDKLFFHLQPNQFTHPKGNSGLNGFENPLEQEKDLKEKWRKEMHYEQLLEENEELKEELENYKQTIERIEEEKDNIKAARDVGFQGIADFALAGLEKKFKHFFMPTDDLSGANAAPGQQTNKQDNTFKRKSTGRSEPEDVESEEVEGVELTDEDIGHLNTLRDIKQRVGGVELHNVIHLLQLVTHNPQSIHFAIKQVTNYLKQKPTANPVTDKNQANSEEINY